MKKNILIHAINGIGLGHIRRLVTIASKIREMGAAGNIIFLTNSSDPFLIHQAGFGVHRLDCGIEDILDGKEMKDIEQRQLDIMHDIIADQSIDVVIHDTYFVTPLLKTKQELQHFLVLRDSELNYLQQIAPYLPLFHGIFLPHLMDELSGEKQDFYKQHHRLHWSGYVIGEESMSPNIDRFDTRVMLISPGYGGDYDQVKVFFLHICEVFDTCFELFADYEIRVVLGKHSGRLRKQIPFPDFMHVYDICESMQDWFPYTRIFIGRGGYNTVNEVVYAGIPSLLFPASRHAEDQAQRIEYFSRLTQNTGIKKGSYQADSDRQALQELLRLKGTDISSPDHVFDGATRIASQITQQISQPHVLVLKHIFLPKSEHFIFQELQSLAGLQPVVVALEQIHTDIFPTHIPLFSRPEFAPLLVPDYPKKHDGDLYIAFLKYLIFIIKKYHIRVIYTQFFTDAYFIIALKKLLPDIQIISAGRGHDVYSFLAGLGSAETFLSHLDGGLFRDTQMLSHMNTLYPMLKNTHMVRSVLKLDQYSFTLKSFERIDILFGGRFVEKKGICPLLDLIKHLTKYDYVGQIGLVGDGEQKQAIFERISQLGLTDRIKYYGFLEHHEFIDIMSTYNTFLNYSQVSRSGDNEGTNNMVTENVLCGNLVWSTLVGGISDLLQDGETGGVLSGDPVSDAAKIHQALRDWDIQKIVTHANNRAREIFAYQHSHQALSSHLIQLHNSQA